MDYFKKVCLIALLVLVSLTYAWSQVGVRVSYVKHGGKDGYILRPNLLYELSYELSDKEEKLKLGISVGYSKFNTSLDTFPTVTLQYANQTVFLPGYQIYRNYQIIPFGMNTEYKLFDFPISPVIGIDVYIHIISFEEWRHVPTLIDSHEIGGVKSIGWLPRIGFLYDISENLSLNGGIGKLMSLDEEYYKRSYWKTYMCLRYFF